MNKLPAYSVPNERPSDACFARLKLDRELIALNTVSSHNLPSNVCGAERKFELMRDYFLIGVDSVFPYIRIVTTTCTGIVRI